MSNDYKQKYIEMRHKLIESVDVAWRDGYEQGAKDAQMQAQQQQMEAQAQQAAQQAAMMGGAQPGQEGDPNAQMSPEEEQMMMEQGGGQEPMPGQEMPMEGESTELDSKLAELQDLVSKGEKPKVLDLRKIVNELATVRKSQIENFKNKNKKVETAQRSLVKNILKKWSDESKSVTDDLEKILATDGLKLD